LSANAVAELKDAGVDQAIILEMLKGLSAAQRRTLAYPDFITEDDADLIYSDGALKDPGESISLDELLKENGIPRRRPRA